MNPINEVRTKDKEETSDKVFDLMVQDYAESMNDIDSPWT